MKPKITISTKPLTLTQVFTEEFDNNSDGKIDQKRIVTETNTYDKQGNLTSSITASDFNADGKIDDKSTVNNTYDKQGNLTGSVSEATSSFPNGKPNKFVQTNTYDKQGNLTRSIAESDLGADGTIDSKSIETNTYDPQGRLTLSVSQSDQGADGTIEFSDIERFTYDLQGNITTSETGLDFNGDNKIDVGRRAETNTYNQQGKLTLSVREVNDSFSGTIQKAITTNTYDNRGNLIRSTSSSDPSPGSGGIVNTSVKNFTYDAQGILTLSVEEREFQNGAPVIKSTDRQTYKNGKLTFSELRTSSSFGQQTLTSATYDDRGNLTISVDSSTGEGSILGFKKTINNTYDKQNNAIKTVFESDNDGDGKIDAKETINNTYDKQNNLIRSVTDNGIGSQSIVKNTYNQQGKLTLSVTDNNLNGKLKSRDSIRNTYNQKGNLTRTVSESDLDGDGNIDTRKTTASTYDNQDRLSGVSILSKNAQNADVLTNYQAAIFKGTSGNDLLTGTNKADVLTGGGAADIFVVKATSGFDTITDFKKGEDLISLGKGICFSQLSFHNNQILFQGHTLASLTGIQTSTLTASDFINIPGV